MGFLVRKLQNIFFWPHARSTWQWDVLCVLILIFIFLTPKGWFENRERRRWEGNQTGSTSTLLVSPEVIADEEDKPNIERRMRTMTGRSDLQVVGIRKRVDRGGKVLAYEVDIR